MKLLRCEKGHYYDGDKYPTCPQCNQSVMDIDRTMPATDTFGATVPLTNNYQSSFQQSAYQGGGLGEEDDKTVSLYDKSNIKEALEKLETPDDSDNTIGIFHLNKVPTGGNANANANGIMFTSTSSTEPVQLAKSDPSVGWLVCIAGPHMGTDFRLHAGKNKIGRDDKINSVVLSGDHKVSRETQVEVVYDAKSNNFFAVPGPARSLGYVNGGLLMTMAPLSKNDVIELGDTKLMFIPCCDDKFNWNTIYNV